MPGLSKSGYENQVFTAPLAVIYIGESNKPVGKMQNLTFTENFTRIDVREIGQIYTQEIPLTSVNCSFTAQAAVIDFNKLGNALNPFIPHSAINAEEFANTMLLGEVEVDIKVFCKHLVSATIGAGWYPAMGLRPGGAKSSATKVTRDDVGIYLMGIIRGVVLDSRSFNIANDQIMMQNLSGRYLRPMMMYGGQNVIPPAPAASVTEEQTGDEP
jgi:hypothetical protein